MTALECGVKLPHAIPSLDNWVHLYLAFSAADKGTDCPIIIMRVNSIDSLFLNFANPVQNRLPSMANAAKLISV